MARKLLIIMVNTPADDATALASPLLQAMSAAAMEYEVEVILSGVTGRLATPGVAEAVIVEADRGRSAHDLLRDAAEAGVVFKVTGTARDTFGDRLIPEIRDVVGGAYLISEAMDEGTVVFTY